MRGFMYTVMEDGWVMHKSFDTHEEAEAYRDYCRRSYRGSFSVIMTQPENINTYWEATV